jgi:hypothetical protein
MIHVKLTHKKAATKKEMAFSSRSNFEWIELPFTYLPKGSNAGFVHTGEYQDFTLVVFDFDLLPELKGSKYIYNNVEWTRRMNKLGPNWRVWTPSGGLHLWFLIEGSHPEICNAAKIPTFDNKVVCDIRGHNGIIFSPFTSFEGEAYKNQYYPMAFHEEFFTMDVMDLVFEVFEMNKPKEKNNLDEIVNSFTDPTKFVAIEQTADKTLQQIERDTGEMIIRDLSAQTIYQRILDGVFTIPHGKLGDIEEFRVWKNLWLWIYWNRIPFEYARQLLAKNQPAYNEEETLLQLKYINFAYRPSPWETQVLWELYKKTLKINWEDLL